MNFLNLKIFLSLKILFCLFFVTSNLQAYIPSISDIAHKLGFYKKIRNLRIVTKDRLDLLEDKIKASIQNLRASKKYKPAKIEESKLMDIYYFYKNQFDNIFDYIDKMVVTEGDFLDDNNATQEQKEELINRAYNEAQYKINKLVDQAYQSIEKEIKFIKTNLQ